MSYWPKMLYFKNGNLMTQGLYVWADWSAHSAYAAHFAWRPISLWFDNHPLFFGAQFTYPFIMDAISGLLIKIGIDQASAFVYPSMIISIYLLYILYIFYHSILKSGPASFLALSLFLGGGGLIFLWYFFPELMQSAAVFPAKAGQIIGWKNIIISELVPQRAILLGLPVMLTIIYFLLKIKNSDSVIKLILLGACSALLLFIHVHSFIALAIFGTVLLGSRSEQWKPIIIYGISTVVCALPIYFWMFHNGIAADFFRLQIGWLANDKAMDANVVLFWLANWGIFLPLAMFTTWKMRLYGHPVVIAGFVIFLVANIVVFQPWDWDNEKILTWSYLFLSVPVAAFFQQLWLSSRRLLAVCVSITLIPIMLAGGLLEIGFHLALADPKKL